MENWVCYAWVNHEERLGFPHLLIAMDPAKLGMHQKTDVCLLHVGKMTENVDSLFSAVY